VPLFSPGHRVLLVITRISYMVAKLGGSRLVAEWKLNVMLWFVVSERLGVAPRHRSAHTIN